MDDNAITPANDGKRLEPQGLKSSITLAVADDAGSEYAASGSIAPDNDAPDQLK